jgi:hypothetical protein
VEVLFFELIWHLFANVFSLKSLPSKAVLTASNREDQLINLISGFEADESRPESPDEPQPLDAVKLSAQFCSLS